MGEPKKGLLDQLLEEAMAKGAESAREEDYAVSLRDSEGNQVDGIPMSQARKFLFEKFGIGEAPEEPSGDGGKGKEGAGQGTKPTAPTALTKFLGKQQQAS